MKFILLIFCCGLSVSSAAQASPAHDSAKSYRLVCPSYGKDSCFSFSRVEDSPVIPEPDLGYAVYAILNSKVSLTGTMIKQKVEDDCKDRDWYVVAQAKESANVVIYGPGDTGGGVCVGDANKPATLFLAIPVTAVWAEVTGYRNVPRIIPISDAYKQRGVGKDPLRKAPKTLFIHKAPNSDPDKVETCDDSHDISQSESYWIEVCDRHTAPPIVRGYYRNAWLYNRLTGPSVGSATISYSPVIGNLGSLTFGFDVLGNTNTKVGRGWFGGYFLLEKSATQKANLDALGAGLSYDLPIYQTLPSPSRGYLSAPFVREPRVLITAGAEEAPTTPHDVNGLQSATVRLPAVLNLRKQPSSVTFFPVAGVELAEHVATHVLGESSNQIRYLAGADASLRFPFQLTHALFGDKPITIDYSYRNRWLKNPEPFSNYGVPGLTTAPQEVLTKERQPYVRTSFIMPLTAFLQFKVTAQHGSLPPNFHALGWAVQVGISISNTSSVEH